MQSRVHPKADCSGLDMACFVNSNYEICFIIVIFNIMVHWNVIFWYPTELGIVSLAHWGRVTHICVGNLTIIGSDNGLSPGQRQAIIWTNAGILLIRHPGANFSEILIEIHTFSLTKMHLKMSSGKFCPFCLGLNVLKVPECVTHWPKRQDGKHFIDDIFLYISFNKKMMAWCRSGDKPLSGPMFS